MLFSVNYAQPTEAGGDYDLFGIWDDDGTGMTADEYAQSQKPKWQKDDDSGSILGGWSLGDISASDGLTDEESVEAARALIEDAVKAAKAGDKAAQKAVQKAKAKAKAKTKAKTKPTPSASVLPSPAYQQLAAPPQPFPWAMIALAVGVAFFIFRKG